MGMTISKITSQDEEALEYLSALVTIELAVELHRDKPNSAIKSTVARLLPGMKYPRCISIFSGLAKQGFPVGCLSMLRRELEAAVS